MDRVFGNMCCSQGVSMGVGRGEARRGALRGGKGLFRFRFRLEFSANVCVRAFDEFSKQDDDVSPSIERLLVLRVFLSFSLSLCISIRLVSTVPDCLDGNVFLRVTSGASESKVVFWQAVRTEGWNGEVSEGFVLEGLSSSFLFSQSRPSG